MKTTKTTAAARKPAAPAPAAPKAKKTTAKKAPAPKLDKSVAQDAPADELPVIDRTEPHADDELVVCGTDTSATEEPGEPIPAPADEIDNGAADPEPPADPTDASAAFAAAFGAAETAKAETAAAKPVRAPRGERVKPAAELPFGNAHGAKAARLKLAWAAMRARTAVAVANDAAVQTENDFTLCEIVQATVSHLAPPPAGWTRGLVTTEIRTYLPKFVSHAIRSSVNGVGLDVNNLNRPPATPRAPKTPVPAVDPVKFFRAHLATLDANAARLLLAELAAGYVTAPAVSDPTIDRGSLLELD